jgi:hypothetical protein
MESNPPWGGWLRIRQDFLIQPLLALSQPSREPTFPQAAYPALRFGHLAVQPVRAISPKLRNPLYA